MYKIGLTGGIASGKSTVSAILRQEGAYIIDTDKIAHSISAPNQPAWREIVHHFGQQILLGDDSIDRKKLGKIVFSDEKMRKLLENITHSKIQNEVYRQIETAKMNGLAIVVVDVPLLIEVGWTNIVNEVWVVYVDEQTQLFRLMARNNLNKHDATERIKAQMSLGDKVKYADVIINNNGSLEITKTQVITAWRQAQARSAIFRE